jgi:hypothetical protein
MWQIDGRKDCALTWGGLTDIWNTLHIPAHPDSETGNIRTAIRYYPDGYPDKSEGPVGWLKLI